MKVLGVSYGYHDSSVALVVDGRVVSASAEERYTRQKHDSNFPTFAIERVLQDGGLAASDLDRVVFHEDPHAKFSRVLTTALAPFPRSRLEFVQSMKAWLGRKLWALNTLSSRLEVAPEKVRYLSHHFSHAVQAFMGSGFDEAAILVVDAVGDWGCTALFKGSWRDGRPTVERVFKLAFPNSLGLVYSAFTAYCGFSPNDSECSTMALAAFGRPTYVDKVREIVRAMDDGTYEVDQSWFHFLDFYKGAWTQKSVDHFGPARKPNQPLPFRSFGTQGAIDADAQRWADVAFAVQAVIEERIVALAHRLHREVPSKNLCYAGGVSMNCVANQRLVHEGPFERVFIPPDPGDGGTSVGAALYVAAQEGPARPSDAVYGPYLGPAFDETEDLRMLEFVKPEHVRRYLKLGLEQAPFTFRHQTFGTLEALADDVAKRLAEGRIVGWYQGRAELGPRALGRRSILIRPDDEALARRLSRDVKNRAAFRPYALAVTDADATRLLDLPAERLRENRWMQYAWPVREELRAKVASGLHADGTTRPQVCFADDNPEFHALLSAWGRTSGLASLINTSFNPSGYPIVTTPVEALTMFARTGMDALVLGRTVVWKHVDVE